MTEESRIVSSELKEDEIVTDYTLRPKTLDEYVGQEKAKENLKIFMAAANSEMSRLTMCCCTGLRG